MKKKTKNRLGKKWQNLPQHHIDACIIIEVLMEDKQYKDCENYLNKVGYKYRGILSLPVFGEIFRILVRKFEEEIDKEKAFIVVSRLVDKRRMNFSSPQFKTYTIVEKIKDVESRAEPMDALNLAAAITGNADVFVTLDDKLMGNKKLESAFGIKIKHPGEV